MSPWALIWQDENYYLVAFDGVDDRMKHYRVDKMGRVEISNLSREGASQYERMDLAAYTNRTFGMYGGEEEIVSLQFPNRLIGVVLDRFGKDADIRPMTDRVFRVRTKVVVSGQFFGWLAGIGREAVIISPASVKDQYQNWLSEIVTVMQLADGLPGFYGGK